MLVTDPRSGLPVGDVDAPIIDPAFASQHANAIAAAVSNSVDSMILSASGWRAVFASDGDEESGTSDVPAERLVAAALAARAFADHILRTATNPTRPARVAVATDTRPTGALIARAAIRALADAAVDIDFPFVCASPEIMAYASRAAAVDGFFYVSASHNPIGHNGIKMGGADGGVVGGEDAQALIDAFRAAAHDRDAVAHTADLLARSADPAELDVFERLSACKQASLAEYAAFCDEVIRGEGPRGRSAMQALRSRLGSVSPGILGDLNGSARAASIDRDYLQSAGVRLELINDRPGRIAHQIVPEGEGLEPCRSRLELLAREDPRFVMGYVPDNDGDRGNLVYHDRRDGTTRRLGAQEVFALACVAELAWLVHTGALSCRNDGGTTPPCAVVVNGPTSLRVDRIARAFGVELHRAEVGEANVVALARQLRGEGVLVRVIGEGSNGGTITHPSAVRDPLHTLHAVLKLLYAPASDDEKAPSQIWFDRSAGAVAAPATDSGGSRTPSTGTSHAQAHGSLDADAAHDLGALVDSLPRFATTSAFEERAVMRIGGIAHADLKRNFEELLPARLEALLELLPSELGVTSCRLVNYEGTRTVPGPGNRSGSERGGLKVELVDGSGLARAFLWMRGSGTEPVFRVMADVEVPAGTEGHVRAARAEQALLGELRALVGRAAGLTGA